MSPGAWLTDLCQERYEVREKKASKKVIFCSLISFPSSCGFFFCSMMNLHIYLIIRLNMGFSFLVWVLRKSTP